MMIVNRIGEVTRQKGMSVKDLADRAKVAYGTAHGLYTGASKRIDIGILDRICAALEVQPGDVLVRVEEGPGVG